MNGSSILQNDSHLKSDISAEEVELLLTELQTTQKLFRGFKGRDISILAESFSTMSFASEQTIAERGETGTWFGVLLQGRMRLRLPTVQIFLEPGAIIGEMAIFEANAVRSVTVEGAEDGLIATMLMSELPQFVVSCPEVGVKLMLMMAEAAVGKLTDNLRRERVQQERVSLDWAQAREGGLPPSAESALLDSLLLERGFDSAEASKLAGIAQLRTCEQGECLSAAGERLPCIFVVLQGAIAMDLWNVEVDVGGQLGSLDVLGSHVRP